MPLRTPCWVSTQLASHSCLPCFTLGHPGLSFLGAFVHLVVCCSLQAGESAHEPLEPTAEQRPAVSAWTLFALRLLEITLGEPCFGLPVSSMAPSSPGSRSCMVTRTGPSESFSVVHSFTLHSGGTATSKEKAREKQGGHFL